MNARPRRARVREWLEVDGLEVELRRKAMTSLRLHVDPYGRVWLSLPHRSPRSQAVAMVRRHRAWVDGRVAAAQAAPEPPRLWGDLLPDAVGGPALERLYRRELERATSELLARWAPRVGRGPSRLTLRWMTTRWGSCSSRNGRISLNLALAALPAAFLEQVLVHELVHLLEPNHGPRFQARMEALLPDWRSRRAALRRLKPVRRPLASAAPAPALPVQGTIFDQ